MVDYSRYYVDPFLGAKQGMNTLERAFQARDLRQQAATQNALATRSMDLREQGLGLQRQGLEMQQEDKQRELAQRKVEFLANGLDAVQDQGSLDAFKNVIRQMQQVGMFDPNMPDLLPDRYDKAAVDDVKGQLKSALGTAPEWGTPKPIPGGRGAIGITSSRSGETKTVVGQRPVEGRQRDATTTQTLNEEIGDIENQYKNMQSRFFQDEEMRMYREGPPTDPDLYKRLQLEATQALEDDRKALKAKKRPKRLDSILDEVFEAEKEWADIEASLPDPADPANIKDAKGNPVQFRDKKTGDVFQSNGRKWTRVEKGRK